MSHEVEAISDSVNHVSRMHRAHLELGCVLSEPSKQPQALVGDEPGSVRLGDDLSLDLPDHLRRAAVNGPFSELDKFRITENSPVIDTQARVSQYENWLANALCEADLLINPEGAQVRERNRRQNGDNAVGSGYQGAYITRDGVVFCLMIIAGGGGGYAEGPQFYPNQLRQSARSWVLIAI
jgi:hypothetical protein